MENKFQMFFNFDGIGTKIKNFAKWSCWVGIVITWVVSGICLIGAMGDGWPARMIFLILISAGVTPFIIWVGSWLLYAFGELVETVAYIRMHAYNIDVKTTVPASQTPNAPQRPNTNSNTNPNTNPAPPLPEI